MLTLAPAPVMWTLGGVVALLAGLSLWLVARPASFPGRDPDEIWLRTRSWWMIVATVGGALLAGPQAFAAVAATVSFLALKEFVTLVPTRACDRQAVFWAYLTVPCQYLWVGVGLYPAFLVYVPVYVFALMSVRLLSGGETRGFVVAAGSLFWGVMATVYGLSHVAYLWHLGAADDGAGGAALVLFLVLLAQFNDVAQFCFGRTFGRRRIVPRISPAKTWSGFLGGLSATVLLSILAAPWLTPFGPLGAAGAGALIAGAGFAGDVVMSAIKRDAGVKDSGHLLSGHGGILDRVDSLFLSAPLFFHFVGYLYSPEFV